MQKTLRDDPVPQMQHRQVYKSGVHTEILFIYVGPQSARVILD